MHNGFLDVFDYFVIYFTFILSNYVIFYNYVFTNA